VNSRQQATTAMAQQVR